METRNLSEHLKHFEGITESATPGWLRYCAAMEPVVALILVAAVVSATVVASQVPNASGALAAVCILVVAFFAVLVVHLIKLVTYAPPSERQSDDTPQSRVDGESAKEPRKAA